MSQVLTGNAVVSERSKAKKGRASAAQPLSAILCGQVKKSIGRSVGLLRRTMLLASAVAGMTAPAFANDATVGGAPVLVGPGFNLSPIAIWVPIPIAPTVVNVDTEDLNGPFNTVWVTGSIAPTNVNVSAGRTLTSTAGGGIVVGSSTGDVAINSAGAIKSALSGIAVGNAAFGFTPLTANTVIDGKGAGSINATVNGVEAYSLSTTAGKGTIAIQNFTGGITGANDGVLVNFSTGGTVGDVLITGNGNITGTARNGIESYGSGKITITNNGVVTGAINGIASNFGIFTNTAATTVAQTKNVTGGGTGSGIVVGSGTGAINISSSATTTGGTGIFAVSLGNIVVDGAGAGKAVGTTLDGVRVNTTGNAAVQGFTGGIAGANNGVTVNFGTATAGDVLVTGNGDITGTARNGIETYTNGKTTITNNGVVTGAINGIASNFALVSATGDTNIVQTKNVTGGSTGSGIVAGSGSGAITISSTATTTGGLGIWAVASTGNVSADGGGTGVVKGTVLDGVAANTLGNASVNNFATVTGARNGIWVSGVGAGKTSNIQGNGLVGGVTGTGAGFNGIVVGALGVGTLGDTNIGTTTTNGVISGALHGIWVNAIGGAGNTAITVDKNVTGIAGDGIFSGTATGNQTILIKGPAIVQGALYGLATGTSTGTATTTNTGTIQNSGDAVGAAATAGLQAVWLGTGNNVLNNNAGGKIIGGFTTGGLVNTLNNNTGGTWTPSLANAFAGANDTVNNAGLINIRTGATVFSALERLSNAAGGVIDLTYGGTQATNSLTVLGGNFAPGAGSALKLAFNPTLANNAGGIGTDSSSNGKGAADTVFAATLSPAAKSNINLTTVGSVDSLIGTSGSVALVQGSVALPNPGMGASGTFVSSSKYSLIGDPTTGAVKFNLTDASDGGAFLQWAPNITSATMGSFAGGDLSSAGGRGSSMASASGAMGGAASASSFLSGQSANGASNQCLTKGRKTNVWGTLGVGGSKFTAGSGSNFGGAIGIETAPGNIGPDECGRTALGVFGYANTGKTNFATGNSKDDGYGGGAYIRTANDKGWYASALAAIGAVDSRSANYIFKSTARPHASGWMYDGRLGYTTSLSSTTMIDLRGGVTYQNLSTKGFTDSVGIQVKSIKSRLWTLEGTVGLSSQLGQRTTGFIRGGAKWLHLKRKTNAYDIILNGDSTLTVATGELGLQSQVGEKTLFGLSGFGDAGTGLTNYGGRVFLKVNF